MDSSHESLIFQKVSLKKVLPKWQVHPTLAKYHLISDYRRLEWKFICNWRWLLTQDKIFDENLEDLDIENMGRVCEINNRWYVNIKLKNPHSLSR